MPTTPPAVTERLQQARQARAAQNLPEALAAQAGAVALLRDLDDRPSLAHALRHQAEMLVEAGRAADAGPVIAEVLALYVQQPPADPLEDANALRAAAVQAQACGDIAGGTAFWTRARQAYAALDERFAPGPNAGVTECDAQLAALGGGRSA